jgi:hypothetical protein
MSLIATNSKTERNAAYYSNNFPQPIEIRPQSQICLQKFIHTRDSGRWDITLENNTLEFKFGTLQGADSPIRQAVLNRGVYTGADLATEVARALNAANQQQNFKWEVTFVNDPAADPVNQFTVSLTQPDQATFDVKGGNWSTSGIGSVVTNNDTVGGKSKIRFDEVEIDNVGDDCFMRRGIITHGGSHAVANFKKDRLTGDWAVLQTGCVANIQSKVGARPPADGSGYNFDPQMADINLTASNAGVEIGGVEYSVGPTGRQGWRRAKEFRTLPLTWLDSVAPTDDDELRFIFTTVQRLGTGGSVANTAGDWIIQVEKKSAGGTYAPLVAGAGGTIAAYNPADPSAPTSVNIVQDVTIDWAGSTQIFESVIFTSAPRQTGTSQDFFQFAPLPANPTIRGKLAPYIPFVTTNATEETSEFLYYNLEDAEPYLNGGNTVQYDEFVDVRSDNTNSYTYRVKREDNLGVLIRYEWWKPQPDPNGNAGLSQTIWEARNGTTDITFIPDDTATANNVFQVTSPDTTPILTGVGGGGNFTSQNPGPLDLVLSTVEHECNGYYNPSLNAVSPPATQIVMEEPDAEELGGTPYVASSFNAPPPVAMLGDLPRTAFLWFNRSTGGGGTSTIGQTLGFAIPLTTGANDRGQYYSTGSPATYPWNNTNTNAPNTLAGNATLHVGIAELSNIRTFEGARADAALGATNINSAGNGDITNTIAVLPRQEFTSDRNTGELVYTAPYENWININNAATLNINQLTVVVRNADGSLGSDLTNETTAIFKLREDPQEAAQRREDKRIENFGKMIANQLDRQVQFTGS